MGQSIANYRVVIPTESTLLTYSMKRNPFWEANRLSASQEIPRILWNPKIHYRIQVPATCPYPEPVRSSPYSHNPVVEDPS